jgi:hypothetical protein
MFPSAPDGADIKGATATATGTLVTVPAGKWFTGNGILSGSVAAAGTCIPTVSVSGTNASPASGTVLARINLAGLALTTVAAAAPFEILVYADTDPVDIVFTAGANGTSSASISGYIFG